MVNEILIRHLDDSTDMSEEDRILVFYGSIVNWSRKHSSQAIKDFSVYDFLNRDQESGVVTVHFLQTTPRRPIVLTEWDVVLLTAYFKSVRPAFMHRSAHPSEPRLLVFTEFREFTSSFFVNSTGQHDFKTGNIVLQFVEKIKASRRNLTTIGLGNSQLLSTDSQLPAMETLRR